MVHVVLALISVGGVPDDALESLVPELAATFGAEVVVLPGIAMPEGAWDAAREQYRSAVVNDALAKVKRPEHTRLLGVVDVDLYAPRLNFVFGEADPARGVAVFSLARLHDRDRALYAQRAATEAIHELGHTFGLDHCRERRCVMWFSNTLSESDTKGDAALRRARGAAGQGPGPRAMRERSCGSCCRPWARGETCNRSSRWRRGCASWGTRCGCACRPTSSRG